MRRRAFLRAGALLGSTASAGCVYGGLPSRRRSAGSVPPVLEYRPRTVYRPTLDTGMVPVGTATAGPFAVAVTYSHPSRFWNVTGTRRQLTAIEADDDIHLMTTVWDRETGTVLPEAGVTAELTRDGDLVSEEVVYPMLSGRMGFHYGGNFGLEGDGRYTVRVRIGGLQTRRVGAFAERLDDPATATVPFDYSRAEHEAIPRRERDDAGDPGALPRRLPAGVPAARAPRPDALPGRLLGTVRTGALDLAATVLPVPNALGSGTGTPTASSGDTRTATPTTAPATTTAGRKTTGDGQNDGSDGTDGSAAYLAVSARTAHNRTVVPSMGLAATVERDGATRWEGTLTRTLGPELGYHYATTLPGLRDGDRVTLWPTVPPQVARHEGYETAFFDLAPAGLTADRLE